MQEMLVLFEDQYQYAAIKMVFKILEVHEKLIPYFPFAPPSSVTVGGYYFSSLLLPCKLSICTM